MEPQLYLPSKEQYYIAFWFFTIGLIISHFGVKKLDGEYSNRKKKTTAYFNLIWFKLVSSLFPN